MFNVLTAPFVFSVLIFCSCGPFSDDGLWLHIMWVDVVIKVCSEKLLSGMW
jgi:hypothetical protein